MVHIIFEDIDLEELIEEHQQFVSHTLVKLLDECSGTLPINFC
jgi:hypothetical protein